ncbi:hypothetical protein DMB92_00200 [Campylobacter sp. MIT 99-7217]|uniref:hypothetical protein n=1 Tax=Campylobacter sp. MIT 99-7217 TaxID=535091 RepID=UPI00115BE562|nr:hypothetical protein [Campylobacter sp. MIT 99-7217]TQR34425.1 hypothetical protein DMB92_00200 [Campylobacter sp. MIT 99-7217]
MTKLPDKIFIADKQMKFNTKFDKAYKDISDKFTIVERDSLPDEAKDIKIHGNMHEVPINEAKFGLYVQSPVYKNRYYPLYKYDNNVYYGEIWECMHDLANRMGDNVKIVAAGFLEEVSSENNSSSFSVGAGGNYKVYNGEAEFKREVEANKERNNSTTTSVGTRVMGGKHTRKELHEYINKEHINIDALPTEFKNLVKLFLDKDEVKLGGYEYKIETIKTNDEYLDISNKFSLNGGVSLIFSAKFDIDTKEAHEKQYKRKHKIAYSIAFN